MSSTSNYYGLFPKVSQIVLKLKVSRDERTQVALSAQSMNKPWSLLARASLCIFIGLSSCLLCITLLKRISAATPHVWEVPADLLPGNPKPDSATCDASEYARFGVTFCSVSEDDLGIVRFTYDARLQAIFCTRYAPQNVTVGDLLLAWGTPETYVPEGHGTELFWGKKAAMVLTELQPDALVDLISYYHDIAGLSLPQLEWRGFVAMD